MIFTVVNLSQWMHDLLLKHGFDPRIADKFDELIVAAILVVIAFVLDFILQWIFVGSMKKFDQFHKFKWNELLIKRKVIQHLIRTLPGIFVYIFLPIIFIKGKHLLHITDKVCIIFIIFELCLAINGFLLMLLDAYNQREVSKSKPLKGLVQVCQVIVFFVAAIIFIGIIIDKSPTVLFTGLGASAAVLMLIFKDSILGFVAGIQLSANDMLRNGDWIQVPGTDANGNVIDVTINTVKVQNWDNTISMVPPALLVNNSFKNWRGMSESGGRRSAKNIYLDMNTIKFCTPDMLDKYRKEIPLMAEYKPADGVIPTNSQVYRFYIERYLRSLPQVNTDLDVIIDQEQMTQFGVPIQVYFFSRDKVWYDYEVIQSDIFDHLIAIVPQFDLKVYQLDCTKPN